MFSRLQLFHHDAEVQQAAIQTFPKVINFTYMYSWLIEIF